MCRECVRVRVRTCVYLHVRVRVLVYVHTQTHVFICVHTAGASSISNAQYFQTNVLPPEYCSTYLRFVFTCLSPSPRSRSSRGRRSCNAGKSGTCWGSGATEGLFRLLFCAQGHMSALATRVCAHTIRANVFLYLVHCLCVRVCVCVCVCVCVLDASYRRILIFAHFIFIF